MVNSCQRASSGSLYTTKLSNYQSRFLHLAFTVFSPYSQSHMDQSQRTDTSSTDTTTVDWFSSILISVQISQAHMKWSSYTNFLIVNKTESRCTTTLDQTEEMFYTRILLYYILFCLSSVFSVGLLNRNLGMKFLSSLRGCEIFGLRCLQKNY